MAKVISSETAHRKKDSNLNKGLVRKEKALEPSHVENRGRAAYRLRLAGKSVHEIADHLQCEVGEVYVALDYVYKAEASTMSAGERESILKLEVARLDALMAANWDSAMYGEVQNAKIVLECIKERAKIQHLYDLDPEINKTTVLVVGDGQRSYIEALKEVAGDD